MSVSKSRKKTRQCLFQALYSRSYLRNEFDKSLFLSSFFDCEENSFIDLDYFNDLFSWIIEKEGELIFIIEKLAPKFDVTIMPIINLIPIFIASYEQLYFTWDSIPERVSIDEALNLTKIFSDDKGRIFVNWVLNSLKEKKSFITEELSNLQDKKFYFFNSKYDE